MIWKEDSFLFSIPIKTSGFFYRRYGITFSVKMALGFLRIVLRLYKDYNRSIPGFLYQYIFCIQHKQFLTISDTIIIMELQ